ncbi:hypothetical protein SmphiM12_198 [Sinorhizobium phage phiM12]|uniref:Uncharacterized protein n=1 Tax=Sinorhizobium phage phiM12 TaxID=1357423 RepID=S5MPS3_9CAUD|nr:hypothetical protein AB690_gp362 [Sinorhizobium phage phiM12]AGR47830.1 hypothetical protein SmphiM12_198 [Sinorhizobium phage phiM12]AKF13040.1 hypothetical protein PHIM19_135 [Sinorhizobium phage phiM19]
MTRQEIFNTVWKGLESQGWNVSMTAESNHHTTCAYRGANGRKCAAGWLIPDDEYEPSMEGMMVLETDYFGNKFSPTTLEFIADLQDIHDQFHLNPESSVLLLEPALRAFAHKKRLKIPEWKSRASASASVSAAANNATKAGH